MLTPTGEHLPDRASSGVKLSTKEMEPSEARLERSATLPKYDITIRPKSQPAAVVWFLPLALAERREPPGFPTVIPGGSRRAATK